MALESKDIEQVKAWTSTVPTQIGTAGTGVYAIAETIPRSQVTLNTVAIAASGLAAWYPIMLPGDTTISNATVVGGAQASVASTHGWFALYRAVFDPVVGNVRYAGNLIAQTTDDTAATPVAANTVYTRAFPAGTVTQGGGLYFIAISFTVTTTMPNFAGNAAMATNAGLQTLLPFRASTGGSALVGVAPATLNVATTSVVNIPYIALS